MLVKILLMFQKASKKFTDIISAKAQTHEKVEKFSLNSYHYIRSIRSDNIESMMISFETHVVCKYYCCVFHVLAVCTTERRAPSWVCSCTSWVSCSCTFSSWPTPRPAWSGRHTSSPSPTGQSAGSCMAPSTVSLSVRRSGGSPWSSQPSDLDVTHGLTG